MKKLLLILSLALTATTLGSRASAATLYTSGAINGTIDAYNLDGGQAITDSFTLASTASLATADVGLWVSGGSTLLSVTWAIGTTRFGTDISSGTSTLTNTFHNSAVGGGYSVYDSTFALSGVLPSAGTYYFTLYNATSSTSGGVYWDVNNGASTAYIGTTPPGSTNYGSISSESFTLSSANTPASSVPDTGATWAMMLGSVGLLAAAQRFYGIRRA